ncbi:tocopherol cyclase family protein [Rhodococcus maanshanensis]|uniref:Tocopherol cyclase n=1 Tax=Rhodococcus maanshanensis TaxID=183556 RepID=A0A1H7J9Q5_9NOCA|nr:tocopherol cyclase family protein [Rhodococcus maanshanensis]SEK70627.1 Tocopherol cyclase [Rhodococcus maanshanensis]
MSRLLDAYRRTGADLPFGDPLAAHGVAMEGYFWRFTLPESGRVVIALCGVNRAADGGWATLGLAAHPGGFLRTTAHPVAAADPHRLGAVAGEAFRGEPGRLRVDLGPDAGLDVRITDPKPWPRRILGGSSVFQTIPALNQYWHPWLLGGRAEGTAMLGDEEWDLTGAQVYAEKNWGRGGFPDSWWWGQAQGFAEPQVCVAFAGGQVSAGPLRTEVTAVVVLLPDGRLLRLGDPVISPVRAQVTDEHWTLRGRSPRWSVHIEGHGAIGDAHVLPVPLPAERRNVPGALEHLGARMSVTVRRGHRTVWSGESTVAALEHGGLARARTEAARRGARPDATDAPPLPGSF